MSDPRSTCPISCALDILGDRWTLVILRDLVMGGRRRFSELGKPEGIATNVLSERLERLEREGIVTRRRDPDDGRRRIVEPTEKGLALAPVLLELAIWGRDHAGGTAKPELVEAARADREGTLARIREAWR